MTGPLNPTVEALLRQAGRESDAARRQAADRASAIVAEGRHEAGELLEKARAEGAAEMRAYGTAEHIRARRNARTLALTARREALEELRDRTRRAVAALRDDGRLRERLAELAREAAGDGAVVTESGDGGVVAEAPGRRVDCGLHALADRAVDALGAEVERLWTR